MRTISVKGSTQQKKRNPNIPKTRKAESLIPNASHGPLSQFSHQYALQDQQIVFSTSVDPHNILSEAMGDQLVHVEENHVEYYEARKENGESK